MSPSRLMLDHSCFEETIMSVRNRIDDCQVLLSANRLEGALLSVLLGVAATSRKR
jgi:hypothetical protein